MPTFDNGVEYTKNRIGKIQTGNPYNSRLRQDEANPVYQAGLSNPVGYTNYDIDLGNTGWWNDYNTGMRDQYNDAVNQVNAAGRKAYGNDWNNLGGAVDIGWYDGNTKNQDWRGNYSRGNTGYDASFNDWLSGNTGYGKIGNQDWNTFSKNASNAYQKAIQQMGEGYADNALKDYNYKSTDSRFTDLVGQRNQQLYDDALKVLNRDRDRGVLSNVGYQSALDRLNGTFDYNGSQLASEGQNWYNNALVDMNQILADELYNNPGDWQENYGLFRSGNLDKLGQYDTAMEELGKYAKNRISDDAFLSALGSDLYDTDGYVATGANKQGLYNPFFDTDVNGRKRLRYNSIGEF